MRSAEVTRMKHHELFARHCTSPEGINSSHTGPFERNFAMRTNEYRGRRYDVASTAVAEGVYRGVFDIDSTSDEMTDGVINEATCDTFATADAAEDAADAGARRWIDIEADKS